MANPKQLQLLKEKGVDAWNAWRKAHPDVSIDLTNADLQNTDLQKVNLQNAKLDGANLIDANLIGANLKKANLFTADLTSAAINNCNLERVNLIGAKLEGANFEGAKLQSANLINANFKRAKLSFANLTGANLKRAVFEQSNLSSAFLNHTTLNGARFIRANLQGAYLNGVEMKEAEIEDCQFHQSTMGNLVLEDIDLSSAAGLETVKHLAPSTIGRGTFIKTGKALPLSFLRGAGLAEWEIEASKLHRPELTPTQVTDIVYKIDELRNSAPIQIHNLFISYAHKDSHFVDTIEPLLQERNIRFWRDIHNASAGPLENILVRAIEHNPTVLLILSKHSIDSDWVAFEIEQARKLEKNTSAPSSAPSPSTVPSLRRAGKVSSGALKRQLERYHILNFSNWKEQEVLQQQFEKLVKGLDLFYREEG